MLSISLKSIMFWFTHPKLIIHRLNYWIWEKSHPNEPWMCPGTIKFCQTHLSPPMSALEFGSGRSSIWFSQRVQNLTSVEHDVNWYQSVKEKLEKENVTNINLRLITLDHPLSEPEHDFYEKIPSYVAILDEFDDGSLDLIIVDGHYRTTCAKNCFHKIKPGGYLLIDDTNLWPSLTSLSIPQDWSIVDQSTNGIKTCIVWQKPLLEL